MADTFTTNSHFTYLNIKPLVSNQLPAVLELDHLCFGGLWTEAGYQREIDSPNSALLVLEASNQTSAANIQNLHQDSKRSGWPITHSQNAAETSAIIGIGCVWFVLEEAHITVLGIHPRYRMQGLGTLMLIALLSAALDWGSEWATLEVRRSNHIAQALYNRLGFALVGQRKKYYSDTKEDALILWHRGLQELSFSEKIADMTQVVGKRVAASGWKLHTSFNSSANYKFEDAT